jgi:hypothetical protein
MTADGRPSTLEIGNGGRPLEVGDREPGDGTMDEFEQRDWVKLGVAATLSRQYAADQRARTSADARHALARWVE